MSTSSGVVAALTRSLVVALAALGLVAGLPALAAPAAAETRSPLKWPFSRDSIWNKPIGSGARYVHAGLEAANAAWPEGRVTADPELISVNPNDRLATLSAPDQPGNGARVRVASDINHDGSWNGCATLLTSDGRSVWQGQPLRLSTGGNPSWRWTAHKEPIDLRSSGAEGCHGGSRLSGIGGSLRVGDLNSSGPIRHAMKVNLYCKKYCYRGSTRSGSKRWPAFTADSYWENYGGDVPALKMGALLALKPGADLSAITHPKARKMAIAFRDYGAYVVDDTTWDVHTLAMDKRVVTSGEWPRGNDMTFHNQLQRVFRMLHVVDNNSPTSVGGGGTPRAPLAPCFTGDTACIEQESDDDAEPVSTGAVGDDPYVSSLTPTRATNGWGPVERDRSNGDSGAGDGRTLTIGGRTWSRGLGVHAASDVTYDLDGRYAHFSTAVGIDDEVGSRGSAVFEVYVDGVLAERTARRTGSDGSLELDVSVSGADTLRLVVRDGGDGNSYDHADWAGARLWSPGS